MVRVQLRPHLAYFHLLRDPRNHLVQYFGERRGGLEAQQIPRLVNRRRPLLDIVLISRIADVAEWLAGAVDLPPDQLCQFQNRGTYRGREVEILVERSRVLDASADSAGEIAAIGIVAYLLTITQNVQRILALHQFLYQVWNHVRHGQTTCRS